MQVFAVNSTASFGRRNDKKQTLLLPTAIVGAAGGAVYANQSKIKLDKDNFEKSIKIIDEKLDKTMELQERFDKLKTIFEQQKNYNNSQLSKLGITENATEISVDDLLKNYVGNPEKTIIGLSHDIEWAKGEQANLKGEALAKKLEDIKEKEFIKSLVEKATDGKVKIEDIKNFFENQIKENKLIKNEMQNFTHIVGNFNSKRIGLFAVIGLLVGGAIGHLVKINSPTKK